MGRDRSDQERESAIYGMGIDPYQRLHDECAGDVAAADTAEIVCTELHDGDILFVHISLQIGPGLTGGLEIGSGGNGGGSTSEGGVGLILDTQWDGTISYTW